MKKYMIGLISKVKRIWINIIFNIKYTMFPENGAKGFSREKIESSENFLIRVIGLNVIGLNDPPFGGVTIRLNDSVPDNEIKAVSGTLYEMSSTQLIDIAEFLLKNSATKNVAIMIINIINNLPNDSYCNIPSDLINKVSVKLTTAVKAYGVLVSDDILRHEDSLAKIIIRFGKDAIRSILLDIINDIIYGYEIKTNICITCKHCKFSTRYTGLRYCVELNPRVPSYLTVEDVNILYPEASIGRMDCGVVATTAVTTSPYLPMAIARCARYEEKKHK